MFVLFRLLHRCVGLVLSRSVYWVYGPDRLIVGGSASVETVLAVCPLALVGSYQPLSGRLSVYEVWRRPSVTETVVK